MPTPLSRDELAEAYLKQLPYPPYPVQEEALLAWFTAAKGVLVCAPTGTGKTLIAEAALFEALHNGTTAYYTTPLIALTEQKFAEMQAAAVRWGFSPEDVGLVTGNRRVNSRARVLVVVAEILLNRLLHQAAFDFTPVSAVVMDEFHSFADVERGIVWELSLGMLPPHVKLLLLSATVGNSQEFVNWLDRCHGRKIELVQGTERRVPLNYQWVPDELLGEFATRISQGDDASRQTPALVFCFNRDECWSVAEQLKGCHLLNEPTRSRLLDEVNRLDLSQGAGTKLKQLLMRGVGVHHAGLLPKYRRVVEHLFQKKLLAICVCTETLAAGINLPARSVVLTSLVKGPPGEQKLLEASTAHQIFGRAGRPQYDDRGYVFALAHEDDVKILRWKQKYDAIPEDTKDPGLLKAKKALKKKRPSRRENQTYWNEQQFDKLKLAPPGKLYSKGQLPWRLLAYLLTISPDVDLIRKLIRKRLMDEPRIRAGEQALDRMLLTLWSGGYVTLEPEPPKKNEETEQPKAEPAPAKGLLGLLQATSPVEPPPPPPRYSPRLAHPTETLPRLLSFRSVNPLYGAFLIEQLGVADRTERLQALESVLGLPGPVLKYVRVPRDLPAGPLAATRLDDELIARGLMAAPVPEEEADDQRDRDEPFERPPMLAEKLRLLFDALHPDVRDVDTQAVWVAGELFFFGGDFNNFVKSRDLIKQEGLIFRHLLRLILLCEEFATISPPEVEPAAWQAELRELAERITASCRQVDPTSTEEAIQHAHAADLVEGETGAAAPG
ncbi:MAG TPA: DEAD/DEAH box helicase [Pirellulales bacterium]|nr:DEAD/DEAH box helicase [Pirellulales bacterium]